jgi:hypothetical protein
MLTGNLDGNILATKVPNEYYLINTILEKDKNFNNIVTFPNALYEAYNWGINSNTSIIAQNYYLKDYFFNKPIIYNRAALMLQEQNKIFKDLFSYKYSLKNVENDFDLMNIKYIIIHKDLVDVYSIQPIKYQQYNQYFSSRREYKLLLTNRFFNLYEYQGKNSIIQGEKISYERISDTKYIIKAELRNEKEKISFLNNFNNKWKLYPVRTGYHPTSNIFNDILFIGKQPIPEIYHSTEHTYGNKWTVNKSIILDNFDKNYYSQNLDGSIIVTFTLFYQPQSYLVLGISISILTICIILFSLIYSLKKKL